MKRTDEHKLHFKGGLGPRKPDNRPDDTVMLFLRRNGSYENQTEAGWLLDNQESVLRFDQQNPGQKDRTRGDITHGTMTEGKAASDGAVDPHDGL